ncbi:MAG: epoxyqueuosine reductase QueH [Kosmotogaceae bacterium]|nr:epoxyqueuosine reductase QueH [Kosmotogaceae bacterium]
MNLLHVCCAPDLVSTVFKMEELRGSELFFYNPNIFPEDEFFRRYEAFEEVCESLSIACPEPTYCPEDFSKILSSYVDEKEGGIRCSKCIELRLRKTAEMAKSIGAESFSTTLLASPRKSIKHITLIGEMIANEIDIEFIPGNFRVDRGRLNTLIRDIYRQDYCGCQASLNEMKKEREIRDTRDRERLERDFGALVDLWKFRGKMVLRSEIPISDTSEMKKLIGIIKPATLCDDLEDAELKNRRWLKTGTYNCRILREKDQ